ncbi:hypothetical protein AB0N07_49170 [Streptomyces sp. NPDC051172]|uniref:hypothetical protein n=1 Tax=Streptomyces sp. NPDC051172 TaxID=3155796 RepID=UPI003449D597
MPADEACRFGFFTTEDQHRLMAEARAATLQTMEDFITWAADDGAAPLYLHKLREARSTARDFQRLTRRYPSAARPKFLVQMPSWTWPGRSVAAELSPVPRPTSSGGWPLPPTGAAPRPWSRRWRRPGSAPSTRTGSAWDTHRYTERPFRL